MRPYDAKTEDDLLKLKTDNFGEREHWSILHNGDYVSLHSPAGGSTAHFVQIPREQFNAIVDWYMAEQEPRHDD